MTGIVYRVRHDSGQGLIGTVAVTERTFDWPLFFNVQDYLKGALGIYRGQPEDVILEFDRSAARWVGDRTWHPSQIIEPAARGALRMRLNVAVTPELIQWVLGFGPQVQVRAPAQLARAVQDAAWRLLSRYERLPKRRTRARVSGARKRTGGGN